MANAISNIKDVGGVIAKLAAKEFEDNLAFCKSIQKADESDYNGKNGYKAGDTVYINRPNITIPTSSFDQTSTIQDVSETTVPMSLDIISSAAFEMDTLELATEIDIKNFWERFGKHAVKDLSHDFENKVLAKATAGVYNTVGTAGSTTFDPDTILSAREKISKYLCPKDNERYFLFDSTAGRSAVNARKGLFQDASQIAMQYKEGFVGRSDGFNWIESEMVQTHTNGTDVTFEVRTTVSTEGATSLVVEGLTATTGTVTKGTTFTIDTVFAVHPVTKKQYDFLQTFTVTADATADGSGFATLSISPAIYTSASNGLQNVSAFPADGDTCNVLTGAASTGYTQNLAFHKRAFRLATVPLVMPKNAEFAGQFNYNGINVAVVYDWDQLKRSMVLRFDVLGALVLERAEWACRITN